MPFAQSNPAINARQFAALLAGFDLGNGNDEEALAKARAMRRMASRAGMRIVDLLEVPEVKVAIDAQLSPKRVPDPALQEALELTSALQEEVTERTRDVGNLAEQLRRQEARNDELERALSVARSSTATYSAGPQYSAPSLRLRLLLVPLPRPHHREPYQCGACSWARRRWRLRC